MRWFKHTSFQNQMPIMYDQAFSNIRIERISYFLPSVDIYTSGKTSVFKSLYVSNYLNGFKSSTKKRMKASNLIVFVGKVNGRPLSSSRLQCGISSEGLGIPPCIDILLQYEQIVLSYLCELIYRQLIGIYNIPMDSLNKKKGA